MAENTEVAALRSEVQRLHTALESVAEDAAAMRRIQSVARWIIGASLLVNIVVLINVLQLSGAA